MAGKIYSSQDPGLTSFQQNSRLAVEKIINTPLDHFFTSPVDMGVETLAEAFAMSDPDYQLKQQRKMESGVKEQYEDTPDHEFQSLVRKYEKAGSVEAMAEIQKQKKIDWAQRTVDFFNEHPDGKDDSWMSKNFGNIMKAVFVVGTAGAGAAAMGAGAAAGAGAGAAAGAGAGTAAAGAGAAAGVGAGTAAAGAGAAGAAAAGSGVAGALGLSGLPASMLNAGLINAGVKAGTNLATGQSIFDGVLKSGLTGAVGAGLAPAASGFVGTGLKNLGISPEMAGSLIKPITTGVVGAGLGLANGQNVGGALLGGLQGGLASYGGDMISEYTNSLGLDKPIKGVLDSAGKGALSAGIRGGNVFQGALQGGVSGGIKQGTNWLTELFKQPSSGGKMDLTSLFGGGSGDSKDWLSALETDLSNPSGAPYDPNFTNYFGKPEDKFTIGDAETPDMSYFESLFGNNSSSGGVSDSLIKALGGAAGNASSGFVSNLMKQLGGVGTAASQNPLASIAAALGAYGSIKNAGKPQGDLSLVDKLMDKGAAQMNTPVQPRGQVVARDPRLFTQNYDLDGRPVKVGIETELADMYRDELGRAPDQAGMEWWKQAMEKGANRDQVMQGLDASNEGTVFDAYRSELGRNPDTDGGKWWQTQLDNGTLKAGDLNAELRKSQEYQQGRNGPLTTMFNGGK